MTKQDFELVEAAIKEIWDAYTEKDHREVLLAVIELLSQRLAKTNKRFDKKRFMEGCGLTQAS